MSPLSSAPPQQDPVVQVTEGALRGARSLAHASVRAGQKSCESWTTAGRRSKGAASNGSAPDEHAPPKR